MVPRIIAVVLAADRSSVDPTAILGLLLALGGVFVTLKPPRKRPVVRVLAGGCLAAAAYLLLTYFSVSLLVRVLASALVLLAYLAWAFIIDTKVTREHRLQLHRILDTAGQAIKARTPVAITEQESSILSCHLDSVGQDVTSWNKLLGDEETRRKNLRDALAKRLDPLIDETVNRDVVLKGLFAITLARATDGRLDQPIPSMLDTPDAVFRAWPVPGAGGAVVFGEESRAPGTVAQFPADSVPPGEVTAHAAALLAPVYELLREAQRWGDARALIYAHEAVEKVRKGQLPKKIRAARRRKWVRRVRGCPVCAREALARG